MAAKNGRRRGLRGVVWLTVLVVIGLTARNVLRVRAGTVANVEFIEHTADLAGGCAVIGMTERQPGFLLLSALNWEQLSVNAAMQSSLAAGSFTVFKVRTPTAEVERRLRGPELVIIDATGQITALPVRWSLADFQELREALDPEAGDIKRHGEPFCYVREVLERWPEGRTPEVAGAFLVPRCPTPHRHEH